MQSWAVALERKRDFGKTRSYLEKATPTAATSQTDRLKWSSAMGFFCWFEVRLSDAVEHLGDAPAALSSDPETVTVYLALLGNDATLSLHLGDPVRAYRLVDRMITMRASVESVPLSGETSLFIARAALTRHRKDNTRAAEIVHDGLDWMNANTCARAVLPKPRLSV